MELGAYAVPTNPTFRTGVLGGTFDPPHNGHLTIAREALVHLKLDQVLFAPTQSPPLKDVQHVTPIADRLVMVRLAIANEPHFSLSRVDADRPGPTYTVDTMRLLRQQFGENVELYFVMGLDSLANLLRWRAPEQLIQLCQLAVFERPGFTVDLNALEDKLPGLRKRVVFIPAPALDISAHELQRRVRTGESIAKFVPEAVAAYIDEHKLYQEK